MEQINKITTKIDNSEDKNDLVQQVILNYINKLSNPFVVLTVRDVSKDLNIGINQAYNLFKQEEFPAIKIGKKNGITLAQYLLWKMNKRGEV